MSDSDNIERRLREIEAEIGPAKVKEPSAAERARQPAKKTRWRNARKARKLRKPVPGPARVPQPSRRGRIWSLVVVVVVLACMAGAAVMLIKLAKHPLKVPSADNRPVTNGTTPTSSPARSGSSGASFLPTPTLAAPFLGTPARSYADGAAGIVIPPSRAVGRYSAEQVAAAFHMTRRLLIAANLNGPTLAGNAPDAFASLLIPQQRSQFTSGLKLTGFTRGGSERNTRSWATSFAPGTTQLVGSVIKVHGATQATTGTNGAWGVLRIHADYLFVYAVEAPGQPSTLTRVVVRYIIDDDFAAYSDPGGPLQPWWRLDQFFQAGAQCRTDDGYLHPQFPNGPPPKVQPKGAPINPYDQGTRPPNACQRTTGT